MSADRVVNPGDARAARVALSVTSAMHELAVREAFPRLAATDFAAMRQANRRLADALQANDVDAAIAADDQFHALPVAVSGNVGLRTVLKQFAPSLRRAERLRFSAPDGRDPVAQHDRVLELGGAGNLDAAVAATRAEWLSLEPLLGLADGRPDPA